MTGQNLEFVALVAAGVFAWMIKRLVDAVLARGGVMTLLTPVLARCHLTWLVRGSVTPADTPETPPVDTPVTPFDPHGAVLVGGAERTISVRDRYADVVIGDDDDQVVTDQVPTQRDRASRAEIAVWCARMSDRGWSRAEILSDGAETFGVSTSTMVRAYREATQR
jgi:hypothetical protein